MLRLLLALCCAGALAAGDAPRATEPVVVRSSPLCGAELVDPGLAEVRVTFDRPMADGAWSWTTTGGGAFPDEAGQPRFLADRRTCVLPVRLKPGTRYALGINYGRFTNFRDEQQLRALPWVLTFTTGSSAAADPERALLDLGLAVADELAGGRFDKVIARCDGRMRQALDAARLEAVWKEGSAGGGEFRGFDPPRSETADGHRLVVVTCRWQQQALDLRVVPDAQGRISGLWLKPATR